MSIYTYDNFRQKITDGVRPEDDDKLLRTFCSREFLAYFKRTNNDDKIYRYMLTFTLRDSEYAKCVADVGYEDVIEKYIRKQLLREPLQVVESHLVKEYGTGKGRTHWHCSMSTKICLKHDRFDYYEKKYGKCDISKTKAQTLNNSLKYISKDSIPTKLQ